MSHHLFPVGTEHWLLTAISTNGVVMVDRVRIQISNCDQIIAQSVIRHDVYEMPNGSYSNGRNVGARRLVNGEHDLAFVNTVGVGLGAQVLHKSMADLRHRINIRSVPSEPALDRLDYLRNSHPEVRFVK